ncbi:MAG: hypothetical protein ACXVFK_18125 [Solirubrobacteraceae bacterium]
MQRALAALASVLVVVLSCAAPAVGARPALPGSLDRGMARGCGTALRGDVGALLCDRSGRSPRPISASGPGARAAGRGRLLAPHGLRTGTTVTVASGRARRDTQLILLFAVRNRLVYVRFGAVGARRATVTSRRTAGGALVARLRSAGRTRRPDVQRLVPDAPAPTAPAPTPAAAAPAPVTPPADTPAPPRRAGAVVGDHVEERECGAAPPAAGAPAAAFDAAWARGGDGWTGGDGATSVALPDGREVWLFGDSFLGPLDGTTRLDSPLVNNTMVVDDGACSTTLYGGTPAAPAALVTPPDTGWFWPAAATVEGGVLRVVLLRFTHRGDAQPGWDFVYRDSWIVTFSLPDLRQIALTPVPDSSAIQWGSTLLVDGGFTYVFGVEDQGAVKYVHLSRVPAGDLPGAWEYFTGDGWSADPAASARLLTGVSNLYSVVPTAAGFTLITQEPGFGLGVLASSAPAPDGPWTALRTIATLPDPGPGSFSYNAVAHPELSGADGLLLSTSTNALSFADLFGDASTYRPRFLKLPAITD